MLFYSLIYILSSLFLREVYILRMNFKGKVGLMKALYSLSTLAILLLSTSCSDSDKNIDSKPIARVESEILTVADLKQKLGSKATKTQEREFVQRWLDRELLYQAARKKNLHKKPIYQEKLQEGERNLLSMAYLNTLVHTDKQEVSESDVRFYFNENRNKYVRNDDVIRFATYSVSSVTSAWNVRKGLNPKNFYSSSRRFSKATTVPEKDIQFISRSSLPSELSNKLFSIKEGGITTPIRAGDVVNLYLIIEKGKKGEQATLAEVHSDVRNQLITSRYQTQIDSAMTTLRSESDFTFDNEYFNTPKDSQISLRGNQ